MKKSTWKRIAFTTLAVFGFLVVVLIVHIYVVTRPRPDASTRIMARIDIRQPIGQADADKITGWLYSQKGVDHVLVNPRTAIAIFTFAPLQNDGSRIARDFKTSLPYKNAQRILPTELQLQGGCPVAATSMVYKMSRFIKHIF